MTEPVGLGDPTPDRRARLVVAYDGGAFHGFAEQHGVPTVGGTLRVALETIARRPVDMIGAGRTDAGVHGWGQVVSVDLPGHLHMRDLVRRLNGLCGPSIVVRSGEWAEEGFDARFSAHWRHYRYDVLNATMPNPLLAAHVWHVSRPLSLPLMQLACDPLIGVHDFTSFCRKPKMSVQDRADGRPQKSLTRQVMLAHWTSLPDDHLGPGEQLLRFEIRANAFCHQMVRSIVGTLVDVGLGKLHAGDIRPILLAKDRNTAGSVAPPQGLVLWQVGY